MCLQDGEVMEPPTDRHHGDNGGTDNTDGAHELVEDVESAGTRGGREEEDRGNEEGQDDGCLLYTSPSPRD